MEYSQGGGTIIYNNQLFQDFLLPFSSFGITAKDTDLCFSKFWLVLGFRENCAVMFLNVPSPDLKTESE